MAARNDSMVLLLSLVLAKVTDVDENVRGSPSSLESAFISWEGPTDDSSVRNNERDALLCL
jgi:hypothetical protein